MPQEFDNPPAAPVDFHRPSRITTSLGKKDFYSRYGDTYNAREGVSGLWFPEQDWMVMDPRNLSHHNQQYAAVMRDHGPLSPVMPWAANFTSGGVYIDLPSSAGGLYQILAERDLLDEVDSWRYGFQVGPDVLWPVVYCARLVDIPGTAEVTFHHKPRRKMSADPNYSVTKTFQLQQAYAELRFTNVGLPEPLVNRDL